MKKREPVSHIMTKNVHSISLEQGNLAEAKKMMNENHIRHLPVVSGQKLVGMLSLTDILRVSYGANYNQEEVDNAIFHSFSLEQVMKAEPRSVTPNTPIKEVAEELAVEEFHALPVVDQSGILKGIVTTTDLVKFLAEQY